MWETRTHTHTHTHTHTQTRHPHTWRDETRGGSREGGRRERRGRQTVTHRGQRQECWRQAQAALPGITEIVFKARNTLNVRRAETLPRFTNSVIYLQDQMHSYFTALHRQEARNTCTTQTSEEQNHLMEFPSNLYSRAGSVGVQCETSLSS